MELENSSLKIIIYPLLLAVVLLAIPKYLLHANQVYFLTTLCIPVIFAISYNMIYGYAGMLSLAHAAFFGVGAYTFYYAVDFTSSIILSLIVVLILTFVFGLFIGVVSNRAKGTGFIVVTFLVTVISSRLANSYSSITGGTDGFFINLPKIDLLVTKISISGIYPAYALIVLVTIGVFFLFRHILEFSTIGVVLEGIRENEERMKSMGYDVDRFKILSFSIAGAFAGIAGALQGIYLSFLSAESFGITLSFDALVYTLLGGAGTIIGPVIGGIFMRSLEYYGSEFIEQYLFLPGFALIFIVLFYRKGLRGLIEKLRSEL